MKQLKRFSTVLLCMILVLSMGGCGKGVQIELTELGTDVNLHSQEQTDFLNELASSHDFSCIEHYAQGIWENSRPEPVALSWTAEPAEGITGYTVMLSKQENMSEPVCILTTEKTSAEIYNLELGTTYYWTVTAKTDEGSVTSEAASFTTCSQGPRNLRIKGVANARDLGGWATEDGGYVKQGMIYRCGRLNTSNIDSIKIEIKEEGIQMLREILGVKTQIDLRGDEEAVWLSESPLGDDIAYYRFPMSWKSNLLRDNTEPIKQTFALLAEEANYPMIIHCNIGTDRTGLTCFLINALLGVSEHDLCLDYVFSNFGAIKGTRYVDIIQDEYLTVLNSMPGQTLSEKTYNYLLQIGVPAEQLEAVQAIMIQKSENT